MILVSCLGDALSQAVVFLLLGIAISLSGFCSTGRLGTRSYLEVLCAESCPLEKASGGFATFIFLFFSGAHGTALAKAIVRSL